MSFLDLFTNDKAVEKAENHEDFAEKLPKILLKVLAAVAAIVFLACLIAFIVRHDKAGQNYRKSDPSVEKVLNRSKKTDEKVSAYTQLGQLRLSLRAEEGKTATILLVSPWFSYPQGDSAFEEELSKKERQIKSIFTEYFSCYTKDELLKKGEVTIKSELKDTINSSLVLNQIKDIYFSEYVFF